MPATVGCWYVGQPAAYVGVACHGGAAGGVGGGTDATGIAPATVGCASLAMAAGRATGRPQFAQYTVDASRRCPQLPQYEDSGDSGDPSDPCPLPPSICIHTFFRHQ